MLERFSSIIILLNIFIKFDYWQSQCILELHYVDGAWTFLFISFIWIWSPVKCHAPFELINQIKLNLFDLQISRYAIYYSFTRIFHFWDNLIFAKF